MSCFRSLFCHSPQNIMESVECPSPHEDQEFVDLSMTDETDDLCSICLSCLTGPTRFQKYDCVVIAIVQKQYLNTYLLINNIKIHGCIVHALLHCEHDNQRL